MPQDRLIKRTPYFSKQAQTLQRQAVRQALETNDLKCLRLVKVKIFYFLVIIIPRTEIVSVGGPTYAHFSLTDWS